MFTPELLKAAKDQVKRQIRPMKIGGRDYYLALVHPDWKPILKLSAKEQYKIKSRGKRLQIRLKKENPDLGEKLLMLGDNSFLIGLDAK